jgi:hypothetical protein
MSDIISSHPARKCVTGIFATVALFALYSFGALAVTGAASIAGASSAFAQSYYYRGRGRSVRGRGVKSTSKKGGRGRGFNKGSSLNLGSGGPSGQIRGVGSSFDDRRGSDFRGGGGGVVRDYAEPVRSGGGGGGSSRGATASRTTEDARRAAAIESCAQSYRSYDRETMSFTDHNGRRQPCP